MNQQMECDQLIEQRRTSDQVGDGDDRTTQRYVERTSLHPGKNFIERSSSLPIVSGTVFYASLTYNSVKGKYVLVGSFMDEIENLVHSAATVIFDASKKVVNLNYLDDLACKGLDKIEYTLPIITKPGDEIIKDSREYALSKISGVTDPAEIPSSVSEAVADRTEYIKFRLSDSIWKNRVTSTITGSVGKILDKTEFVIDALLPKQDGNSSNECANDGTVFQRASCLAQNTKKRIIDLAKKLNKNESRENDNKLTVKDVIAVTNYSLSNYYKKLLEKPEAERIASKVLRLSILTSVGVILTINGVLAATWPRVENKVSSSFITIKNSFVRVVNPFKDAAFKAIVPVKSAYTKWMEMIRGKSKEAMVFVENTYCNILNNLPESVSKLANRGLKHRKESLVPSNESIVPLTASHSNNRPSELKIEQLKDTFINNSKSPKVTFQDWPVTESSTPDFVSLLDSEEEKEEFEKNSKEDYVKFLEDFDEGSFCDASETTLVASGEDSNFCSSDVSFSKSEELKGKFFKWAKF